MRNRKIMNILLLAGAAGWGISVLGILLPWRCVHPLLKNMGMAQEIADPQIVYWFRMAAGSWSVIGFLFLMTFLHPEKYWNLIPLLGFGSLAEGVTLLIYGFTLNRPMFPFIGDVLFCLLTGGGILLTGRKMRTEKQTGTKGAE